MRMSGVVEVDRFNGTRGSTGHGAQRDTGLNGTLGSTGQGLNGTRGSTGPWAQQTCTFVNI